jgi:hypothetical protein
MVGIQHRKIRASPGESNNNEITDRTQQQNSNRMITVGKFRISVEKVAVLAICIFSLAAFLPKVVHYDVSYIDGLGIILGQNAISRDQIYLTRCQYDGHCPVQYTCSVLPNENSVTKTDIGSEGYAGICELISLRSLKIKKQTKSSSGFEECTKTCEKELILDEHYYHERAITIKTKIPVVSFGRPKGCLLTFKREVGRDPEITNRLDELDRNNPHPSSEQPEQIQRWMDQRFRYVIRTDPILENKTIDENIWFAYCFNGCQSDHDCISLNDKNNMGTAPGFVCVEGACQRNEEYWNDERDERPKMVLVTGATTDYFHGLKNLLASALYWAPSNPVVVYNLGGLDKGMIETIKSYKNVLAVEWIDGIPKVKDKTNHLSTPKGYAWKPIIINETVHKYGQIFWLDAGNTLAGPITPAEKIVRRTGSYLVKGQDSNMKQKSDAQTYLYLGFDKDTFIGGPHFSGNTQAYMYPSRYIDTIVKPMTECALVEECIMPNGHNLASHRYDQTVLSILAYISSVQAPHYTEYLAATSDQLKGLSTPSSRFVWTARQGCSEYSVMYDAGTILN